MMSNYTNSTSQPAKWSNLSHKGHNCHLCVKIVPWQQEHALATGDRKWCHLSKSTKMVHSIWSSQTIIAKYSWFMDLKVIMNIAQKKIYMAGTMLDDLCSIQRMKTENIDINNSCCSDFLQSKVEQGNNWRWDCHTT